MKPYTRHLLFCSGDDCDGKKLLKEAKKHLKSQAKTTKCSKVGCLGACKQGPMVVVYPDGVWYRCPNREALRIIIREHLEKGRPVEKYVVYQMPTPETV